MYIVQNIISNIRSRKSDKKGPQFMHLSINLVTSKLPKLKLRIFRHLTLESAKMKPLYFFFAIAISYTSFSSS